MATIDSLTPKPTPLATDTIELNDGLKAELGSLPVSTPQTTAINSAVATHAALTSTHGSTALATPSRIAERDSDGAVAFAGLDLDTTTIAGAFKAGRARWNDTVKCWEIDLEAGTTLQVGQENLRRVRNSTGSTLLNGAAVYINGATGNLPTIALAQANSLTISSRTIGLVTTDPSIANNGNGFVCISGTVNGLNTSAFIDGDVLYLRDDVAGGLSTTAPTADGSAVVVVGIVVRAHGTLGAILVRTQYLGSVTGYGVVNSASKSAARTAISAAAAAIGDDDTLRGYQNFACWGDSLTANTGGISYPRQLQAGSLFVAYEGGVGGETSTQIRTRFLAATDKLDQNIVIWAGRNNYAAPTTVKADIAAMVAAIPHQRYLILSIPNSTAEVSGSGTYNSIIALNNDLEALYGAHYFDIREYLVTNGLSDAGITPTGTDTTDIANDCPPTSLRSDALHWNTAGGGVIASKVLSVFVDQIAPLADANAVTLRDIYALFGSRPQLTQGNPLQLPVISTDPSAPGSGVLVYSQAEKQISFRDTAQVLRLDLSGLGGSRTVTAFDGNGTMMLRGASVNRASAEELLQQFNTATSGRISQQYGETSASALTLQWRGSTAGDSGGLFKQAAGHVYASGAGGLNVFASGNGPVRIGAGNSGNFTLQYVFSSSRFASILPIGLPAYTVSTLPTGSVGDLAYVTDATAPTYLGTLTGGGSVRCPVFYNGTAWVSH